MPEDFTITAVKDGGLVDNPKGPGQLQRQYVTAKGPDGTETSDVYLRRKPENAASVGSVVFGELEKNDQGWRLFPKQRDGGSSGVGYRPPDPERSRRIERQHSQEMSVRTLAACDVMSLRDPSSLRALIKDWTDWFARDLDADVGSGQAAHGASDNHPPVAEDAADLSAGPRVDVAAAPQSPHLPLDATPQHEEASPQLKGTLTQLFNKAGLSREAMKAVVLFRCGAEKATKQGAQQLITDLQEGATHDALLAEIYDAKRAGNPLGARAAALIPSEVPWTDDGSLPPAKDITT